jgi:hypothetical protein
MLMTADGEILAHDNYGGHYSSDAERYTQRITIFLRASNWTARDAPPAALLFWFVSKAGGVWLRALVLLLSRP